MCSTTDETATVTADRMRVVGVDGADPDHLLMLAAALEDASDQEIAAAIAQAGRDSLGALPPLRDSSTPGLGVARTVLSDLVRAG
ncbi:MAG: hypothetical protein Q7V58_02305 [Actinomycetota bacterium]|nr:hypothetical protein [Actinomycetota bacterium]